MIEFITENIKEIILAIIALFVGTTLSIRFINNIKHSSSNKVIQKGNKVDGDMAGRDINK